jgi:hypothetical protein
MAGQNKSWRAVRERRPLNEARVAMYRRLMDAEQRLDPLRRRRGVEETAFGQALEAGEDSAAPDLYLATVAEYVAALGGHLEVRAVFPEETVTLLQDPPPSG